MVGKNQPTSRVGDLIVNKKLFNGLGGYEKGVAARVLLQDIIRQGYFDERLRDNQQVAEITIPLQPWQMSLLACFCNEAGPEETISERIQEALRHVK